MIADVLSLLRAGNWREVHTGRRCMRLEVTYDYATWKRLMAEVESALAQQPAVLAKHQPCGCVICTCEDEKRCHGCGAKHCGTHPVTQFVNPEYDRQPAAVDAHELWAAAQLAPGEVIEDGVGRIEGILHNAAAQAAEIEALREQLDWAVKENDRLLAEGSELTARAERLAEALHKLEEACDDSDGAQYGTLGTSFVRGICKDALLRNQKAEVTP